MDALNERNQTEKDFLKEYKHQVNKYEKASNTADIVLFTTMKNAEKKQDLKVLLIKRKDHPSINQWAIPGGFMNMNESLDITAKRELFEETNVKDVFLKQIETVSAVDRDPRTRIVSTVYMALINGEKLNIKAGDDAGEALWFTVRKRMEKDRLVLVIENIENNINIEYFINFSVETNGRVRSNVQTLEHIEGTSKLAFDHEEILNNALFNLRREIDTTPIAFNLLGEEFSLGEVQDIYEAIWGKNLPKNHPDYNTYTTSLDRPNFRKKIKPYIIKTDKKEKNVRGVGAPGFLYKFNVNYIIN